jgi:hypothetical protein
LYYPVQDALTLLAHLLPYTDFDVAGFCGLDGATPRWHFPPIPRQTPPLAALVAFVKEIARLQREGEPEGFCLDNDQAVDQLNDLIDVARALLGPYFPTPEGDPR